MGITFKYGTTTTYGLNLTVESRKCYRYAIELESWCCWSGKRCWVIHGAEDFVKVLGQDFAEDICGRWRLRRCLLHSSLRSQVGR